MEELNLNKLTQSLHTPKPSPMKRAKPRVPKQLLDVSVIRRSSRVVDLSPRNYKEVPIETMGRAARTRSYSSGHSRRDLSDQIYASYEDREYATQRAEDLQSGLDQDIPNFVKPMLQSHVTGGFWMPFPLPINFQSWRHKRKPTHRKTHGKTKITAMILSKLHS